MKKYLIPVLFFPLLLSCKSASLVGDLTMVSNRNIDSGINYSLLQSYANDHGRKLKKKKNRAKTIEEAIDKTVRNVEGGEFIKNAKIFLIKRGDKVYFSVTGDVWGVKSN